MTLLLLFVFVFDDVLVLSSPSGSNERISLIRLATKTSLTEIWYVSRPMERNGGVPAVAGAADDDDDELIIMVIL
jgi:hypothetical protein